MGIKNKTNFTTVIPCPSLSWGQLRRPNSTEKSHWGSKSILSLVRMRKKSHVWVLIMCQAFHLFHIILLFNPYIWIISFNPYLDSEKVHNFLFYQWASWGLTSNWLNKWQNKDSNLGLLHSKHSLGEGSRMSPKVQAWLQETVSASSQFYSNSDGETTQERNHTRRPK